MKILDEYETRAMIFGIGIIMGSITTLVITIAIKGWECLAWD